MEKNKLVASVASYCAWRCLEGEESLESVGDAVEIMGDMLLEQGLRVEAGDLSRAFIREFLRVLLNESNALHNYPHSDSDLDLSVVPAFARLFGNLEKPLLMRDAFDKYNLEGRYFPRPNQIMELLPAAALKKLACDLTSKEEEGTYTPGYARQCYERFMESRRREKMGNVLNFADGKVIDRS